MNMSMPFSDFALLFSILNTGQTFLLKGNLFFHEAAHSKSLTRGFQFRRKKAMSLNRHNRGSNENVCVQTIFLS